MWVFFFLLTTMFLSQWYTVKLCIIAQSKVMHYRPSGSSLLGVLLMSIIEVPIYTQCKSPFLSVSRVHMVQVSGIGTGAECGPRGTQEWQTLRALFKVLYVVI